MNQDEMKKFQELIQDISKLHMFMLQRNLMGEYQEWHNELFVSMPRPPEDEDSKK